MSGQGQQGPRNATILAKDLAPWQPDIDARKSDKPQIITGMNFVDDIDGPRSAFSSSFVNWNYWDAATRGKVNELRIVNDILYGTQTGVYKINKVSGVTEELLQINVTKLFWPWTIAYVGGVYYLAQYDIGLWQYDPVNNTVAHVDTPAGDIIRGIAESFGRLIYLTDIDVGVSALDDGTDLTPSLTSGAGAQPLSLVGGTGFRVEPIPDGFLVYLSEGIIKATFVQAAYVFQYKALTNGVKIFSPNAAVYIPRLGAVSLDNSGFNLTREYNYQDYGTPQPWEIEKGDYIKKNILASLDQTLLGTICLYYSQAEQKLFVSFSSNTSEGLMQTGFVYNIVNKRWGSFDWANTGIFETYSSLNNIYTCSYIGADGFMRAFSNTTFSQDVPALPGELQNYVYRTENEQKVLSVINDSDVEFQLVTTEILQSDANPLAYANYVGFSGLFYINYLPYSDTHNDSIDDPTFIPGPPIIVGTYINMDGQGVIELIAIPLELPQIGINSSLTIGPFRLNDQEYADETCAVQILILGLTATSNFTIYEDWNVEVGSEDWNTETGYIDWGFGGVIPNTFDLTLRSSNDGINPGIQGDEPLYIFNDLGSSLTYSPMGYSSIYQILTLDCVDVGQSYALKVIDFTGLLTGRLVNQ